MRHKILWVIALGLLTAACGTNEEQRTSTGALTGAGIGALAGGPVGALIGAGAGAVGGAVEPEDPTTVANNLLGREHRAANAALGMRDQPRAASAAPGEASGSSAEARDDVVKEAQSQLKDQGLYNGRVDGIVGPQTRRAVRAYQQREGLRQTARLDPETVQHMNLAAAQPAQSNVGSGSSAVPQGNPTPDNRAPSNYNYATPAAPQDYTAPQNASPSPPTDDQPTGTTPQNPPQNQ